MYRIVGGYKHSIQTEYTMIWQTVWLPNIGYPVDQQGILLILFAYVSQITSVSNCFAKNAK